MTTDKQPQNEDIIPVIDPQKEEEPSEIVRVATQILERFRLAFEELAK
ncbi:MAG: hypothetical protein J6R42_05325 [Clostridia bacterium]|nr:hypothetical protein [Clostridia bacterium]